VWLVAGVWSTADSGLLHAAAATSARESNRVSIEFAARADGRSVDVSGIDLFLLALLRARVATLRGGLAATATRCPFSPGHSLRPGRDLFEGVQVSRSGGPFGPGLVPTSGPR